MVEPVFDVHLRNMTPRPHATVGGDASRTKPTDTRSRDSDAESRHALESPSESMQSDASDQGRNPRRGYENSQPSRTNYPIPGPNPQFNANAPPYGQSPFSPGQYTGPMAPQPQFSYLQPYDNHVPPNAHGYQSPMFPSIYPTPAPTDSGSHSFPVIYSSSPHPAAAPQTNGPPFQVFRYSNSPPSAGQYPYPPNTYPQTYPPSPVYQPQYSYVPPGGSYPSYSPPAEMDTASPWWFVQPPVSPRPYDGSPSPFRGPYPVAYSPVQAAGADSSFPSQRPPMSRANSFAITPSPLAPSPSGRVPPETVPPSSASSNEPEPVSRTHQEKPLVRRPYHPNPPSHRSEWVMWVGNVPSDASHDELWRFFNQSDGDARIGVMSIFLISRSSCAFVNYESEANLQQAIGQFNAKALRPNDPRCPRLVCRVRQKDDDLKAGVGGQRGMGLHTKWVKQQKEKGKAKETEETNLDASDDSPSASSSRLSVPPALPSDEDSPARPALQSSNSGSFGSTTSSVLTKYFPKRFFILKSLTQYDLDLSVQKGLWATQKHNEGILDQAYRTSKEVYLIFGVNKSGEFYGYAKMAGPVLQGEHRVSWASRGDSTSSNVSAVTGRHSVLGDTIPEETSVESKSFFPAVEHRLVEESPQPLTTPEQRIVVDSMEVKSAPAETGPGHSKITPLPAALKYSLDTRLFKPEVIAAKSQPALVEPVTEGEFHLDETAPLRAMKQHSEDDVQALEEDHENERLENKESRAEGETWGESFKVEWICTERLPFFRTRHLRNPWNKDREVKVSRDGTELEPGVGQQLIDEWQKLAAEAKAGQIQVVKTPAGRKKQQTSTATTSRS
ncbi:hypothetical protein BDZ89DRAFT_1022147 [Hymenopellis radicata]|nr:hypothetical protein BDZ89DRAFT_1022147 [Hymenopellis radicata]